MFQFRHTEWNVVTDSLIEVKYDISVYPAKILLKQYLNIHSIYPSVRKRGAMRWINILFHAIRHLASIVL